MTYTRPQTRFLVGEKAPDAVEVNEGASVLNHLGNISLKINPTNLLHLEIDTTVEPPELHFREAPVTLVFGVTNPDGEFVVYNNELSRRQSIATGVYVGPGSVLNID